MKRIFAGEFLGTFTLVFIGCGTIGLSILFGWPSSLLQVALLWGAGVALAIFLSMNLSGAHLNPAVSMALLITKGLKPGNLYVYLAAQFSGAFSAAGVLYLLLRSKIESWETASGMLRGDAGTKNIAMMFGEYFPNPAYAKQLVVTVSDAFMVEMCGTALLVFTILIAVEAIGAKHYFFPVIIGLAVSALILTFAPYTQTGINPARDFGPRVFAWLTGWGAEAWAGGVGGSILVYVIGPLLGGIAAALLFVHGIPVLRRISPSGGARRSPQSR